MIPLTLAADLLAENAGLLAVVAVVVRFARAYQTELSWAEYRTLHQVKRVVLPVVKELSRGRIFVVSEKGGRDDEEYLKTVESGYRDVVRALRNGGGTLHLINSIKKRPDTHGDPLSAAHLVWSHADGQQSEVYLFSNADGSTDIYAHVETGVSDPLGHLTNEQYDGDTRNVLDGVTLSAESLGCGIGGLIRQESTRFRSITHNVATSLSSYCRRPNNKVCAHSPQCCEARLRPPARLGRNDRRGAVTVDDPRAV